MAETSKDIDVKKGKHASETPAPVDMFDGLREEMSRAFDNFLTGFPRFPFGREAFDLSNFSTPIGGSAFRAPAVDVKENDKAFVITAELPGMSDEDIGVSLADGVLTIKGEKKDERDEKKDNFHLSERRYGTFQRSFRLPENVDAEKIAGDFSNGVLSLTLPKSDKPHSAERKIDIKAS